MADEDVYENADWLPAGEKAPKTPARPPHARRTLSITPLPVVLLLLLVISLVTLAILCTRLWDAQSVQNSNPAFLAIQAHLETILALQAEAKERNRESMELLCNGWKFYKGSWYFFSEDQKPWWEAEEACVAEKAHLTSVTSRKEMEYIFSKTKEQPFWIGLTDQQEEGNWTWVDGTPYNQDVSFWEPRQPDNWQQTPGHQEDCVQITRLNFWNDVSCTFHFTWICKKVF